MGVSCMHKHSNSYRVLNCKACGAKFDVYFGIPVIIIYTGIYVQCQPFIEVSMQNVLHILKCKTIL